MGKQIEQRFEVSITGVDGEDAGEHYVRARVTRDGRREGDDPCDREVSLDPDEGHDGAAIVVRHARGRDVVTLHRTDSGWHAWPSHESGHASVIVSPDGQSVRVRGTALIDVDWFSVWPPLRVELAQSMGDIASELNDARLLVLYENTRDLSAEQDREAPPAPAELAAESGAAR